MWKRTPTAEEGTSTDCRTMATWTLRWIRRLLRTSAPAMVAACGGVSASRTTARSSRRSSASAASATSGRGVISGIRASQPSRGRRSPPGPAGEERAPRTGGSGPTTGPARRGRSRRTRGRDRSCTTAPARRGRCPRSRCTRSRHWHWAGSGHRRPPQPWQRWTTFSPVTRQYRVISSRYPVWEGFRPTWTKVQPRAVSKSLAAGPASPHSMHAKAWMGRGLSGSGCMSSPPAG
jgi:hypothetical protein